MLNRRISIAFPLPPIAARTQARRWATGLFLGCLAFSAQASDFSFSGTLDSGPLVGESFSGSFGWAGAVPVDGDWALSSFALTLAGQTYLLADADVPATASFAAGVFVGLSFVDADGAASVVRPQVSFVAGFSGLDQAYLAYESAGQGGFGSYSVTAVPEPAAWALMLLGLGVTTAVARRPTTWT